MNRQIFKWEQEADHAVVAAGPDSGLAFCHTKQKLIECSILLKEKCEELKTRKRIRPS